MLASAVHSPAWRSQGYVCLACRRAKTRGQIRWNSEYLAPQASSDSWFDGLNDINDEFGRVNTSNRANKEASLAENTKEEEKRAGVRKEEGKRSIPKQQGKALPVAQQQPPSRQMKALVDSLTGSLRDEVSDSRSPDSITTGSNSSASPVGEGQLSEQVAKSPTRKNVASSPSKESSQRLAESTYRKTQTKGGPSRAAGFDISRFKNIVSSLRTEKLAKDVGTASPQEIPARASLTATGSKEAKAKPTLPRKGLSGRLDNPAGTLNEPGNAIDSSSRLRITKFTSYDRNSVGTDLEKTPVTIPALEAASAQQNTTEQPVTPRFGDQPRSSKSGARLPASKRPMTLVERHRQHVENTTPFGLIAAKALPHHASFESLRKADVSAASDPHSSINATPPFGLSPMPTPTIVSKLREAAEIETLLSLLESDDSADSEAQTRLRDLYAQRPAEPKSKNVPKEPSPRTTGSTRRERINRPGRIERSSKPGHIDSKTTPPAPRGQNVDSNTSIGSTIATAMKATRTKPTVRKFTVGSPDQPERTPTVRKITVGSTVGSPDQPERTPTVRKITVGSPDQPERTPTVPKYTAEPPDEPERTPAEPKSNGDEETESGDTQDQITISPSKINVNPIDVPQPPVPFLQYGLDRVLFNPGVYQLQDVDSRVYNFDPYLQKIMSVPEFDFSALKAYKTSSQDRALATLAQEHGKKYVGSTSSMTSSLAHFHHLLSNWRPLNLSSLSRGFFGKTTKDNFTEIARAPSAIFLRWKNGTYAIDADKEHDTANVLMLLGKSLELLLTLPKDDFERYRRSDPRQIPEEQKTAPESFQYTIMGDFLMRSQLDAYDPRLPGNGAFDLKTRAVVSVRMNAEDFEPMTGYEIVSNQGRWASYEREYYDMARATMLKYMLQARMGCMSGIFVAYHNVKRIFGFQYLPIHQMDHTLHGQKDTCLGDQEFKASLSMLNDVLNRATAKFPEQSLRIHFETRPGDATGKPTALYTFAEPMSEDEIDTIQNSQKEKIAAFEREIMGTDSELDSMEASPRSEDVVPLDAEAGNEIDVDISADVVVQEQAEESDLTENDTNGHEIKSASMITSDGDADKIFLEHIGQKEEAECKPLFHATIIAAHQVNGEYLNPSSRPTDLKSSDKWEIDYLITEYHEEKRVWALYQDMKARRSFAFADKVEDADRGDVESGVALGPTKPDYYIEFLKAMSAKAGAARELVDEMEEGKEIVRVDQGLPKEREIIEGVGDYMEWLYRKKGE